LNYDITLSLLFTTKKKLNIGGGIAPKTKSDVPFMKVKTHIGESEIFIPASTIKGVLRTSLIRISNLFYQLSNVTDTVNPEKLGSSTSDVVLSIFGRPGKSSKIVVSPAIVNGVRTYPLTHVRIDDSTGVAEEQGLFSIEYLPIGVTFKTKISGNNLELEEIRALLAAIAEMRYERIGKAGIVDIKIVRNESKIPEDVVKDPIISTILEVMGIWKFID